MDIGRVKEYDGVLMSGSTIPSVHGSGEIHLAFCVDDNFCQHLAALIQSIISHNSAGIVGHVVSNGLNESNSTALMSMQTETFKLRFYEVQESNFPAASISTRYEQRLNKTTYYRILLPDLLDVDKVLYLDADMLVLGDIQPLWETSLSGMPLAAVIDSSLTQQKRWKVLNTTKAHYFNAGLLLMDLTCWREKKLKERVFSFSSSSVDLEYNDQDLLNLALNEQVMLLDENWNLQSYHYYQGGKGVPHIVHFTGVEKPWHISSIHPLTQQYHDFRSLSAFSEFEPEVYLDAFDRKLIELIEGTVTTASNIAIYGAGQRGRRAFHTLKNVELITITQFVDKQLEGEYEGVDIKKSVDAQVDYILLSSVAFKEQILKQLGDWGIPASKIIHVA